MRILIAVLTMTLVTAGILFLLVRNNSTVRSALSDATTVAQSNGADAFQSWPLRNSWTWSVQVPEDNSQGSSISIRIREKAELLPKADVRSYGPEEVTSRKAATREFGTGRLMDTVPHKGMAPATATIQLLDLSEIGAASDKPGQTLRVVGTLSSGGVITYIPKEEIYLPTGRFVGSTSTHPSEVKWLKNEMLLMAFYVESDTHRYKYDVIAEHTRVDTIK